MVAAVVGVIVAVLVWPWLGVAAIAAGSQRAKAAHVPIEAAPSRRVRVTGVIE